VIPAPTTATGANITLLGEHEIPVKCTANAVRKRKNNSTAAIGGALIIAASATSPIAKEYTASFSSLPRIQPRVTSQRRPPMRATVTM
jgi:hypothetical protein